MLPNETQQLCGKYALLVEARIYHTLELEERFAIYHSFGPSRLDAPGYLKKGRFVDLQEYSDLMETELMNFTVADYCLGWLAILTASHVFPVWDQIKGLLDESEQVVTAQQVIQVAKDLLQGKIIFLEAAEAEDTFYWEGEKIARKATYNIDCAFGSARDSLSIILHGIPRRANRSTEGENGDYFITKALEAYSAIDLNLPGQLRVSLEDFFIQNLSKVLPLEGIKEDKAGNSFNMEYSLENRLHFWKWWLTEAIPQAWKLAEQSYQSKLQ